MKRLTVCALLIGLLLCGCTKPGLRRDVPPEWPQEMTTALSLTLDGTQYTADWTYQSGVSAYTLTAPQELLGVQIVCDGVESRIESGNVQAALPQQSVFLLLHGAYHALAGALAAEPQLTQEGWLYDGMDRYGFEALAQSGTLHIRFPRENAEAVFSIETPDE